MFLLSAAISASAAASFLLARDYPIVRAGVDASPRRRPATSVDFIPSSTLFHPGHQRPLNFYASIPVGLHRPSGQYYTPPEQAPIDAIMTIITPTYNPRNEIFRAARFVQEQSLQAYRWIIVNDHTTDADAIKRLLVLKGLAAKDWRIRVLDNPGPRGGPSAMNFGIKQAKTPFIAILDDDDLWELTSLEKAALVMSWVPDAHAVGFDVVNHGSKEFMWTRGFHQGDENYYFENGLVQGSPLRAQVFEHCQFDVNMSAGAADWDLWMCMASHGMWGLHVPENGSWYQVNSDAFRSQRWKQLASASGLADTHARILNKYKRVLGKDDAWKMVLPPDFDAKSAHPGFGLPPFENNIAPFQRKRVMFILTSLRQSPAMTEMLRFIRSLSIDGFRITVVLTHFLTGHHEMREMIMQYTHDIFTAPLLAPAGDIFRLIAYLVQSRSIRLVLVGQSRFGYAILPALADAFPHVSFVDYISECSAKASRVAAESVKMNDFLDLTIVPTTSVYDCMLQHGKSESNVVIARGGSVNLCDCANHSEEERRRKQALLGLSADQLLVVVDSIADPDLSTEIHNALLLLWRKSKRFRVVWAHAPDSLRTDELDGFAVHTAMLEYESYNLADVIVHGDPYLNNPVMLGCAGAAVIKVSKRPTIQEPYWEWVHGLVFTAQQQPRSFRVLDYARVSKQVFQLARFGVAVGGDFELASSKLLDSVRLGQVACNISDALRRTRLATDRIRQNTLPVSTEKVLIDSIRQELGGSSRVFDMRRIQELMQFRKKRTGFGRALQLRCPERVYENTEWIDALEHVRGCNGVSIDVDALRRSAQDQCGAWCIMNATPSYPNLQGWQLYETCWSPVVDASNPCMTRDAAA